MIKDTITERYARETSTANLGCANLQPFLSVSPGDFILDLGCGRGVHAAKLAVQVGENGFVYGLDITREMIEEANKLYQKANLSFISGDIHQIPLKNNAVNIVISNCVINHTLAKQRVFNEIYRVMKNGGYFLISDVMSIEKLPAEISSNAENLAACWGGAIPKAEYLEIIKNAGFINVKELSTRQYYKHDFLLESIILRGEKNETNHQG